GLWQPQQLDGQLELTAKLAASRLMLDNRRYPTSGDLQVNLALGGTADAPTVDGQINISAGSFADKLLGIELTDINVNLAVTHNQLSVQQGTAKDSGAGTLALSGGCPEIYPAAACQLNLALAGLQIINNRQLEAKATGDIKATLQERQLALSGALNLSPTTLKLSNAFGSSIKELVVEEINKRGQKPTGAFWPSPLIDVQWQLGANSQVRGRGLEAQVEGTLRTQGPLNQLAYNGNFYTTKGTLELFNKRFILDTGDIRLAPGQIYLDMPAHYESRVNSGEDLTIQARLQGDLNHLNLDLRSTPTLPPDEVLARLIFGKRIETITPFEGLQLAAAVNQLRAGDGFNLMDSTRSLLGVDRLKIDSEKNTDGSTGVNVGVGKYISDKVYVEIQRTPNPNTPWQGQIEVELTPSVNFESNTGQNGQGGAKLLWRRDY
ncbi:MAG TPA: translocation/assembly module TamB domain-containing protein, partial [Cellvibrionaceae bacterium]|nr:translocation/assembly module TamB domain-containing protein [Cellvibrionaceae bacterium]